MDFTSKTTDYEESTYVSPPFYSTDVFQSTPKTESEKISYNFMNSKKRKVQYCDVKGRKLSDLLESSQPIPEASSTFNENLSMEFRNIKIEQNYFNIENCDGPATKFFKNNGCERIVTPPTTPESHLKSFDCTPKKSGSFQKCSSCSVPSPLKEQHEILYPNLKPLERQKKPLTPQKFKQKIGYNSTPLRKPSVTPRDNRLLDLILINDVVMEEIFNYLSDGDLFRVAMVSNGFRNALSNNLKAYERCLKFRENHRKNKENYKITPPSSPENQSLFQEGSLSPSSQNFMKFMELGSCLNANQSLTKCPSCNKPSVVEKFIAQCQDINTCGYIFCQKCFSNAFSPEEFFDKCRAITLGQSVKKRRRLEDLSNRSTDFNVSSILSSTAENYSSFNQQYSSGYISGQDLSHSSFSVKRNLSHSFNSNESLLKPQKALFDSNRLQSSDSSTDSYKHVDKRKSFISVVPVVQNEGIKRTEVMGSSSPPPKIHLPCSKQSRKNLKRLTR